MMPSKKESQKTVSAKHQLGGYLNYRVICNSTLLSGITT